MKKYVLLLLLCFFNFFISDFYSQPTNSVASSCTASPFTIAQYKLDAERLAVRRVHHIGVKEKDSVELDKSLRRIYIERLMAIYNATMLPVWDTIINYYYIHTNPDPELQQFSVDAPANLPWMKNLLNGISPTGDAEVDLYISKYKLTVWAYYQATGYDRVVFNSDSSLNLVPLINKFKSLAGVLNVQMVMPFNDVKDIQDSINPNFVQFKFSYGFGTCHDGCDYRIYWTFKVYSDCSVEYLGTSVNYVFQGLSEGKKEILQIRMFPNPSESVLNIKVETAAIILSQITLFDTKGILLQQNNFETNNIKLDLDSLSSGLYFVQIKRGDLVRTLKFSKN